MTAAQTKAKRHYWSKVDKRYLKARKDPEASKRKQLELVSRERALQLRKGQKGKKK